MKKHKQMLKIVQYTSVVINIMLFVFVIGSVEHGAHELFITSSAFVASLIVTWLVSKADSILRHVIAASFCLFTAAYSALRGVNRYGRIFNKLKYDSGGYVGLYLICLKLYDDYVNGRSERVVQPRESDQEYIDFIKDYPEEYIEHVLQGDFSSSKTELKHVRETIVLKYFDSEDPSKRQVMGFRKVVEV